MSRKDVLCIRTGSQRQSDENESLITVRILVCTKCSPRGDNLVVLTCGGSTTTEDCCSLLLFRTFHAEPSVYSTILVCFEKMGEDSSC